MASTGIADCAEEKLPVTGNGSTRASSGFAALCTLLVALASLIPVLSVRFPPMTDYANHYVRMWLLAGGIDRPQVAAFYQLDWNVAWTNIAIDIIAVSLGKIVSMNVIGPFVLALGLLLPPIGITLLNRRLFGGFHWWQLLCFALAWNAVYLFGFISYSISLGLALVLAAVDHLLQRRGRSVILVTRCLSAALLLAAHPFGLLFYAALLVAVDFGPSMAPLRSRAAFLTTASRITLAMLPVLLPLIALLLFGPSLPGDKSVSLLASMHWDSLSPLRVIPVLLTYFRTYDFRVDVLYLILAVVLLRTSAKEGTLQVHWGLMLCAGAIGVVSLVMPTRMLNTGGIENRLPCMMVLAFAAGLRPDLKTRSHPAILALAAAAVLARVAFVDYVWLQRSADVTAVENVLQHVPAGAAVLPLQNEIDDGNVDSMPIGRVVARTYPSFWHYPTLAIMQREAFVPYLFTAKGKQPLRVRPPWSDIAVPEGAPVPVDLLDKPNNSSFPYLSDWKKRFDYLLLMNGDMLNPHGPMPAIANVRLIADEGFARLYKIDHTGAELSTMATPDTKASPGFSDKAVHVTRTQAGAR